MTNDEKTSLMRQQSSHLAPQDEPWALPAEHITDPSEIWPADEALCSSRGA
jgi:hypothetical protein